LLYTATGLVILVILALIIWVIPHVLNDTTPGAFLEKAVTSFWVLIAIHIVILAVLIWKILKSRRGGQLRKIALIIPGIILILMSMFLIDAAGVFLENRPDRIVVAIILFFSACCDMVSGIITIMLPTRIPDNQQIISEQGQNRRK
jgi:hypothetical protein